MLKNWKDRILKGWGLMRLLRLALAGIVFVEAWKNNDWLFASMGAVLFLQSVLNVGCCGAQGCDTGHVLNKEKSVNPNVNNVTFEEIK